MSTDVIILPQGGHEPLCAWTVRSAFDLQLDEWRDAALQFESRAAQGDWPAVDVFLCPLGDHFLAWDSFFMERLLRTARDYCWGSDIYIVADRRIRVSAGQIDDHASMSHWFKTAQEQGTTDIIQVDIDRSGFNPVDPIDLSRASELSKLRQEVLGSRIFTGNWKCHLADLKRRLPAFLDPFVIYPVEPRSDANIVIVVDKGAVDQTELVRDARTRYSASRYLVSALGVHPSADLRAMCQGDHDLALLRCRGHFELRYLMAQLNTTSHRRTTTRTCASQRVTIKDPIFAPPTAQERPGLLVTSSFDPASEYGQYFEAARDAGAIAYERPPGTLYRAHQAITRGNLAQVLRSFSTLTAWVYLGHGDGERGLQEAGSGGFAEPAEWLACFTAYGSALPLAVFSACRSTAIARCFAEAGTGLAIGFEEDVPPEACRLIATPVVRAALLTHGDTQEMLNAYHVGCTDLIAAGYSGVGPKAFYADR
ncbi:MAG: hypothetical protein AABO57_06390 [Acidobacteriota bacterium]